MTILSGDRSRKREIESARNKNIKVAAASEISSLNASVGALWNDALKREVEDTPVAGLFLKDDVKINGAHFNPNISRILTIARETAPNLSDGAVWVTSANDGKHMKGSKHYDNEAFDLRVRNVVGQHPAIERWCARMRKELGEDYDVVYGDANHRDHIHVEFDQT